MIKHIQYLRMSKRNQSFKRQKIFIRRSKKLLQSESIATYEIAYGLWSNNKLDEAKKFAHEAIKLFEQAYDTSRLAESYNLSGVIYKNSFMLDKAILMYKKALKITEQQKDYTLSAIISSNIATLYNELEENQKAIVFSRRFFHTHKQIHLHSIIRSIR